MNNLSLKPIDFFFKYWSQRLFYFFSFFLFLFDILTFFNNKFFLKQIINMIYTLKLSSCNVVIEQNYTIFGANFFQRNIAEYYGLL